MVITRNCQNKKYKKSFVAKKECVYSESFKIFYNTSLNPTEEIYNKPDNDPNGNDNSGGTTIYKTELNFENKQEKSRPNPDEFKRLLSGGANAIQFQL